MQIEVIHTGPEAGVDAGDAAITSADDADADAQDKPDADVMDAFDFDADATMTNETDASDATASQASDGAMPDAYDAMTSDASDAAIDTMAHVRFAFLAPTRAGHEVNVYVGGDLVAGRSDYLDVSARRDISAGAGVPVQVRDGSMLGSGAVLLEQAFDFTAAKYYTVFYIEDGACDADACSGLTQSLLITTDPSSDHATQHRLRFVHAMSNNDFSMRVSHQRPFVTPSIATWTTVAPLSASSPLLTPISVHGEASHIENLSFDFDNNASDDHAWPFDVSMEDDTQIVAVNKAGTVYLVWFNESSTVASAMPTDHHF